MPTLTPMMRQYQQLKEKYKDCILFFRLGDFYEMFFDDAVKASKILGITLTARNKGENKTPMCGIPYHAVENYLGKLTKAGKKVAICEQLSDPSLPGIVQRDVIKIVTPGTTFDQNLIENKANNYLVSIFPKNHYFGLAYCDNTTGEFFVTEITGYKNLQAEFARLNPSECIIRSEFLENEELKRFLESFKAMNLYPFDTFKESYQSLTSHFKTKTLEGFGAEKLPFGIQAAGLLLDYLKETQKADLSHINRLRTYSVESFMVLDEATLRNLELLYTLRDFQKEGSLLSVLDKTLTAMGGRLLKKWLLTPLLQADKIKYRLNGVEELFSNQTLVSELQNLLRKIVDVERILGRIGCNSENARDLVGLKYSLEKIPEIKSYLTEANSQALKDIDKNLVEFEDLVDLISKGITEEPPLSLKEGGLIKEGYNSELDELRKISREGKSYIKSLQEKEIKRTRINSLKVRFNKVFGYYIEVSKSNLKLVPEDYIRKQTLVNAERFITPELKEYEEKVLGAEEKIIALEYKLFLEICKKVAMQISRLQQTAQGIAKLDVLLNFAWLALSNNYIKPEINNEYKIVICDGRHPVVENLVSSSDFVPNDVILDKEQQFLLITGPNMAGKSVYLRQTALIVLLAQIGSFVPAKKAEIGVVDRIFTRVGASDAVIRGQSTFMVEMQETANIINHATSRSLIILDEIGRGTSTYDGVSIAWAIMEYIHDKIGAKTLFATHYHELISVAEKLSRCKNISMAVKEREGSVVFLHKVLEGGINKSYGIEVAKLAGLPREITAKARHILEDLEEGVVEKGIKTRLRDPRKRVSENQLDLFSSIEPHPALEALKELDLDNLTPLQALQKLDELKKM